MMNHTRLYHDTEIVIPIIPVCESDQNLISKQMPYIPDKAVQG